MAQWLKGSGRFAGSRAADDLMPVKGRARGRGGPTLALDGRRSSSTPDMTAKKPAEAGISTISFPVRLVWNAYCNTHVTIAYSSQARTHCQALRRVRDRACGRRENRGVDVNHHRQRTGWFKAGGFLLLASRCNAYPTAKLVIERWRQGSTSFMGQEGEEPR